VPTNATCTLINTTVYSSVYVDPGATLNLGPSGGPGPNADTIYGSVVSNPTMKAFNSLNSLGLNHVYGSVILNGLNSASSFVCGLSVGGQLLLTNAQASVPAVQVGQGCPNPTVNVGGATTISGNAASVLFGGPGAPTSSPHLSGNLVVSNNSGGGHIDNTFVGGTLACGANEPVFSTANNTVSGANGAASGFCPAPGPATHFTVSAPSSATAGNAFNFTVTAQDQFNNTATGYAGTVHFTSTDGSAILPANSTLSNGTGTFSATLVTAGSQTITATDTVTSSIHGTSNSIFVSAATATHFAVSAPSTEHSNVIFNFTVTAQDQFNNTATGYGGTVHFTSSDSGAGVILPANSTLTNGTGTFSAQLFTPGSQTITATDTVTSSITGTSNSITVS
jgi:hypothetical protein